MSKNTLHIPALKPRNPLAVAARARQAGAHRMGRGAQRQREGAALRRELAQLPPPSP